MDKELSAYNAEVYKANLCTLPSRLRIYWIEISLISVTVEFYRSEKCTNMSFVNVLDKWQFAVTSIKRKLVKIMNKKFSYEKLTENSVDKVSTELWR